MRLGSPGRRAVAQGVVWRRTSPTQRMRALAYARRVLSRRALIHRPHPIVCRPTGPASGSSHLLSSCSIMLRPDPVSSFCSPPGCCCCLLASTLSCTAVSIGSFISHVPVIVIGYAVHTCTIRSARINTYYCLIRARVCFRWGGRACRGDLCVALHSSAGMEWRG